MNNMKMYKNLFWSCLICFLFCSCKITGQITQQQINNFLNDTAIATGHVGVSVYEPATGKYLYNYNADKNFMPSSNVKLFSLYAGMKYLGDSIVGIRYLQTDSTISIIPTGDPTLLHPDFNTQPVVDFLKSTNAAVQINKYNFKPTAYGNGWAWNDYPDYYMAERSSFPVYGNCITFITKKNAVQTIPKNLSIFKVDISNQEKNLSTTVKRDFFTNNFNVLLDNSTNETVITPFITSLPLAAKLLSDSLKKSIEIISNDTSTINIKKIYSRPVDSLFKPMMYESDNFFAEQTLLMASNAKLGYMSDEAMIDTLLANDLKDIPTKPRWVDGSGLSRYNLFSPKDFIYILNKLQNEFGLERMKRILPTGGQGTLSSYYLMDKGFIYAKTGSMSNNVSLSGYLISKKNKLLLFSVMINNYDGGGRAGRRAIEKFIHLVRENN